jgi:hypothetical protein
MDESGAHLLISVRKPRLLRSAVDYRGYCPSESLYLRVWLYDLLGHE